MWATTTATATRRLVHAGSRAAASHASCPLARHARPLPSAGQAAVHALGGSRRAMSSSSVGGSAPAVHDPSSDPAVAAADAAAAATGTDPFSWHAFIYDSPPVEGMQAVLEAIQGATGLPWWASIAISTLAFRTALLPVVRYQAHAVAKLARAGPMLLALNQALSRRLDGIRPGDVKSTSEACRAYAGGVSAALKAHDVSLLAAVASPLVQLPVFVTFALANRRMIDTGVPGLEGGGVAWFEDLTEADPLLLLPLAALSSTYMNLELGFAKLHESQTVLRFLKDNLQFLLILGAPLTSTLPAGVFVYWLTSSLFGHAQHFALKDAAVRQALGFPALPPSSPPAAAAAAAAGSEAGGAAGTQSQSQAQQQVPASGGSGSGGGGGVMVDPRLMARAVEILEEYEAKRQRRLARTSQGPEAAAAGGGKGEGGRPASSSSSSAAAAVGSAQPPPRKKNE